MADYKTPGVYIVENSTISGSISAVDSAVPAFVGYTQKAPALNTPYLIRSFKEFVDNFGGAPQTTFAFSSASGSYTIGAATTQNFLLYRSMQFFYANGGGECYIVSVGDYVGDAGSATEDKLNKGIEALKKEMNATILVCPDAMVLGDASNVHTAMLQHCGGDMRNRFAILDVPNGVVIKKTIEKFRDTVTQYLNYGAAYYPWLNTNIVSDREVSFLNISTDTRSHFIEYIQDAYKGSSNLIRGYICGMACGTNATATVSCSDEVVKNCILNADALTQLKVGRELDSDTTLVNAYLNTQVDDLIKPIVKKTTDLTDEEVTELGEINKRINTILGQIDKTPLTALSGVKEIDITPDQTSFDIIFDKTTGVNANDTEVKAAANNQKNQCLAVLNAREIHKVIGKEEKNKNQDNVWAEYLGGDKKLIVAGSNGTIKVGTQEINNYNTADIQKILCMCNADAATIHKTLYSQIPEYRAVMGDILAKMNTLPPSGAMAGVYTYVDNTANVAKAPANIGLSSVLSPTVTISKEDQEDLNIPSSGSGKAINAIRAFKGKGTLVWGARTLDGNSGDWRYIGVRRSMIMIEESIRRALEGYVFAPNNQATWLDINSQITAFLTKMWNQGILMGNKQDEAFQVAIGLGSTMTPQDVIDGYLRISVKLCIVRPAEFIEVTFEQMMPSA